jgi:transposase
MKKSKQTTLEVTNPNAAGIDIGDTEHWVAVPEERDSKSVRKDGNIHRRIVRDR